MIKIRDKANFTSKAKLIEIDIRNGFTKISGKLTTTGKLTTSTYGKKIIIPLTKSYLLLLIVNIISDLNLLNINSHNEILSIPSDEELEDVDINNIEITIKNKITKNPIEKFQLKAIETIMIENNKFNHFDTETVVILKGQKYSVYMYINFKFQLVSQTNITC